MIFLLIASLLWAFSFGLIKGQLAGIDPVVVSAGRLLLAAVVFAPALGRIGLDRRIWLPAIGLGMVQFGLMYVFYIAAFAYLPAWLVVLFTVFTPLYVLLLVDLRTRCFNWRHLAAALLAIAGAAVVVAKGLPTGSGWTGVLLLQLANICFAVGQVYFPDLKKRADGHEATLLAWMYQGAVLLTLVLLPLRGGIDVDSWHRDALLTLLYLGVVPTALGFYLWNKGAARTSPGLLAVANNLKFPLAVLVSWVVFGEQTNYLRALLGLALIVGAVFLAGPMPTKRRGDERSCEPRNDAAVGREPKERSS